MTLAGVDQSWSARQWSAEADPSWCESVRVNDAHLRVFWNDDQRPPPRAQSTQIRTLSAWGGQTQADLARLRVLVVGAGSVGLDVAQRLAATGIQHVGIMDFDTVETSNLDRLIGARPLDARLSRAKVDLARRLARRAATAANPQITAHDMSVCTPEGHRIALDYDVIFSCVDRPWPRAVLNATAYADLIPVIDGASLSTPSTTAPASATPPGAATSCAPDNPASDATDSLTSVWCRSTARSSGRPRLHRRRRTRRPPSPSERRHPVRQRQREPAQPSSSSSPPLPGRG
jgi:hypothetical protein